jgi:nucleoside-diphosphate-sugar epimerase
MSTIAVTGPTGTFGYGLIPLLQADDRVERIVGIARRPFDPAEHGWTKMEYRRGDVREEDTLAQAFAGADAVAHLAFNIYGNADRATLRAINVEGTRNAFLAAARAGVKRFVYASSVAAYGFHADNPIGMTEDHPTRGSKTLFYSQEKAEVEHLLAEEAARHPEVELTLFRPTIVVGPHAAGAGAELVPEAVRKVGSGLLGMLGDAPVPLPAVPPPVPVQLVHEDDVGQAFLLGLLEDHAPGAYNLAADGTLTGAELLREAGLTPVPVPGAVIRAGARAVTALPSVARPAAFDWAEAALHPLVVDNAKAKRELGWTPRYTALEALQDTLRAQREG